MNIRRLITRFPWALALAVAVSIYLAKIVAEQGFGLTGFYALLFGTVVAGMICAALCVAIEKTFSIALFPAPQINETAQEESDNDDQN